MVFALRLHSSVENTNRAFYIISHCIPALNSELDASLTQNVVSRLSRNRHNSLERSLATINHDVLSLSVQHSGIAGRDPSTVSDVYPNCAAFRAEEWDATKFCAGVSYLVQSDHLNSGGSWSPTRKQARVKCALKESKYVMEYFVGTVRAKSSKNIETSRQTGGLKPYREQDQYESQTSYTIYPAPWLIRLGIHYGLHLGFLSSPTQGWKTQLRTFCPVPDNALIFEFCRQGDVPAVRTLLSRGHASVRDTDSLGHTPLHVNFASETDPV